MDTYLDSVSTLQHGGDVGGTVVNMQTGALPNHVADESFSLPLVWMAQYAAIRISRVLRDGGGGGGSALPFAAETP